MMDVKEVAEVTSAYASGKTIQVKSINNDNWYDMNIHEDGRLIAWDFTSLEYRVKPEPKYRPYQNANEFVADMVKHGNILRIKDECNKYTADSFTTVSIIKGGRVFINYDVLGDNVESKYMSFERILETFVWASDGQPCGMKD